MIFSRLWSWLFGNRHLGSESCENCRYYLKDQFSQVGYGRVTSCHRHAPVRNESGSSWPDTHIHDWCGDFERRET